MFPELFREIGRIRKIQAERDFRNRHFGMQKPARLPHSQIQQIFAGRTGEYPAPVPEKGAPGESVFRRQDVQVDPFRIVTAQVRGDPLKPFRVKRIRFRFFPRLLKHDFPEKAKREKVDAVDTAGNGNFFAKKVDFVDQFPDFPGDFQSPCDRTARDPAFPETPRQGTVVKQSECRAGSERRRVKVAARILQINVRKRHPCFDAVLNINGSGVGRGKADCKLHDVFPFPVPRSHRIVVRDQSGERQRRVEAPRKIVEMDVIILHTVSIPHFSRLSRKDWHDCHSLWHGSPRKKRSPRIC